MAGASGTQTVAAADGRTLTIAEWGDPHGFLCVGDGEIDPGVRRSGRDDELVGACRVARMARFRVRSGSLERSLEEVIPLNEAV